MEGPRGRRRYRSPSNYGARPMSVSRSRSRAPGYASSQYRAAVSARRARSMLGTRTAAFLGVEKKYFDTAVAAVALNAPSNATS